MRKAVLAFSVFIITVVAVFAGIMLLGRADSVTAVGTGGQVDLQGINFAHSTAQTTSWGQYPNALVPPANIAWGQTGGNFQETPYGTFYLRLSVPDDEIYVIGFNSVEFATRVFINGQEVDNIGAVSESADGFAPARHYCHYTAAPQNGTIEIVLQYANFYTGYGGYGTMPTLHIGLPTQMFNRQVNTDLLRFSLFTLYIAAFLLYLGIFLFSPKRKETLFFSIICLVLAVREGFIGEEFITSLLPFLSQNSIFLLQYIFIGLLVILSFSFIISLFPFTVPRRGTRIFYIMCGLFLVASLLTRAYMPWLQTLAFLCIGIFIMLYISVNIIRRFKSLSFTRILSAIGIFILFLGIFNDMFHFFHIRLGPIGSMAMLQKVMIVFIFVQMVALFLQFMQAERDLGKSLQKEAELATQNETLQKTNQERAQFLSNVSHELKTPLTVVSNYAQLTRLHEQDDATPDDYVINKMVLVTSEAERMALMVEELIDIARIEEGRMDWNMKKVDIARLIHDAVARYYPILNKNRNTLELQIPSTLPPIYADPQRIEQVVVNLITNAIKFTNRGTITVTANYTGGNRLQIVVADTGSGMGKEQMTRLFERYYTQTGKESPISGTGLGLVISKEIVEAHGGYITVESEPDKGTTATVHLPLAKEDV